MEEKDEIVLSYKIILEVLKRNVIFIIVTVLIFSLSSYFITEYLIDKQYTARLSLYVDTTRNSEYLSNPAANDLNSYNYAQKLVATYIKMLNTKTFYSALSEKLNGKYTASELSKKIKFSTDNETEIFDASVVTANPADAKAIADAVAIVAPSTISRLDTNAELKIVDYASTPTVPSSPSLKKNLFVGFGAGLALSLLIAFIRNFLDKKIKFDEDVNMIDDIPILGAIPHFEISSANTAHKTKD